MEDLQSTLRSILSDPEQMARVSALAESLGLKPEQTGPAGAGQPQPAAGAGGAEGGGDGGFPAFQGLGANAAELPALLARLGSLHGSEETILNALRPSLSPAGQSRIDRALRAAKLSRLAGQLLAGGGERRV